jgi:hypothetical protein
MRKTNRRDFRFKDSLLFANGLSKTSLAEGNGYWIIKVRDGKEIMHGVKEVDLRNRENTEDIRNALQRQIK